MNTGCLERESKELTFIGFNDTAFVSVNHQFQAVLQVLTDTAQHPFTGSPTLYQDRKVIRVAGKSVTALF